MNKFVSVLVPPEAVFDGLTGTLDELKDLLSQLPMIDVLLWACQLNVVVACTGMKPNHLLQQQFGLNIFFSSDEINRINTLAKKSGGAENIFTFFRGQLLELIRWALICCPAERTDAKTFEDPEVRRIFAKAVLVCGSLWSQRVYKTRLGTVNTDGTQKTGTLESQRFSALPSVRNSITQTASAPIYFRAMARGKTLFAKYMPDHYPEFPDVFAQATGLSLQNYLDCWVSLSTQFLSQDVKQTNQHVHIERNCWWHHTSFCQNIPSAEPLFRALLELESQTVEELRAALWLEVSSTDASGVRPFSTTPFRQKPILQLGEDLYVLIDPVFCLEKLSAGPLFHVLKKPELLRSKREPFESFGHAFEAYCNAMLDRMFNPGSSVLEKRLIPNVYYDLPKRKRIEVLDALLIDAECAVFFQTKARWLKEEIFCADDPEAFHEHLLQKYGDGLRQLVTAISKIGGNEWALPEEGANTWKTVYPVLLVHDRFFDGPIQQNFLADEFRRLLQPDEILPSGYFQKGRLTLPQLIIVTVDTVEDLESSLRHFSFVELLRDYCMRYKDRLTPLREFIQKSEYRKNSYGNKQMADDAISAFDSVISNIFREEILD